MRYAICRMLVCASWCLLLSNLSQAQTSPFGNPFDDGTLPRADDTTIPLEDDQAKPADGVEKVAPPSGLFKDKEHDPTKAIKDGADKGEIDLWAGRAGSANAYQRGLRLLADKDWHDAIEYLNDAIKANPRSADAYLGRAQARIGLAGESNEAAQRSTLLSAAVVDCNAALKIVPRSKQAYLTRGIAQRLQNGYKQANLSFTSAIQLDSKFAAAYLRRGIVLFYLNTDAIDPAILDFDKAISINSRDFRAHLWRGLLYSRNAEYEQAIASFGQALAAQPDYADALKNRGLAYWKIGKFEEALEDFTELTRVATADKTAFFNRGVVESELEQFEAAAASFEQAIELDSKYAAAFYNRSIAYAQLDDFDKSDADYEKAIELNSDLQD